MAQPKKILSLDGGGIRGISTLQILENIMEKIQKIDKLDKTPLPCEYFDLIGGTSTGGIIAIMLGRLGMSVDACIKAYGKVAATAFTPKRVPRLPGPPKGAFSATALENAIKTVIMEQCQDPECIKRRSESVKDPGQCPHANQVFRDKECCKTVVLAITKDDVSASATLFTTYGDSKDFEACSIWEVARATSAATTFFKSMTCGRDRIEFVDAGFGYNNPCKILMEEAHQTFSEKTPLLTLSIGTGLGGVVTIEDSRRSIIKALGEMATTSKRVADELEAKEELRGIYYRFNVERGLDGVTLSDWEKSSKISAHTHNYLREKQTALSECATAFAKTSPARAPEQLQKSVDYTASIAEGNPARTASFPSTHGLSAETSADVTAIRPRTPMQAADQTTVNTNNLIFSVPLDTNKNYVFRPGLDSAINDILKQAKVETSNPPRIALYGLGGSGKTETALRFVENHRKSYEAVFWINGVDELHLLEGFSGISQSLDLGSGLKSGLATQKALDWLNNHQEWLLVIDNLDNDGVIDIFLRKYTNAGMRGTFLITSRNERVTRLWSSVQVSDMEPTEADSLLRKITGPYARDSDEIAKALLKDLGFLALAVDQAASFIAETGISIAEYYQLFTTQREHLLKKFPSTQYNVHHRENVMTTWEISFDHIQRANQPASILLLLLSLLHHEDIPRAILEAALQGQLHWAPNGEFENLPLRDRWVPEALSTVLCSDIGLIEAIAALKKYSLVRYQQSSRSLVIHPLVHYWSSQRLGRDKKLEKLLQICIVGLVSSVFEKQDRLPPLSPRTHGSRGLEESTLGIWPWRQYNHLIPHALRCLNYAEQITNLSEPVATMTLSLLQVLEYATYGKFQHDQELALRLIKHLESTKSPQDEDSYLLISTNLWRLNRMDLCKCRKHLRLVGTEVDKTVAKTDHEFCELCQTAYKIAFNFVTASPKTIRAKCATECLQFRLAWDPFWAHYLLRHGVRGYVQNHPYDYKPPTFSQQLGSQSSWLRKYCLTLRRYLLLRTECEYEWGKRLRMHGTGSKEYWSMETIYDTDEPMGIAASFQSICGATSEEFRRSAFYASTALVAKREWDQVESFLLPLIQMSIGTPVSSWSHERCIVRYAESLLKQDKVKEAQAMLSRIKEAYLGAGKNLKALEKSHLLHKDKAGGGPDPSIPRKDIQIFAKSLNGQTITIDTNTCATVRSVIDSIILKEGLFWGETRIIYGGKQLESERFLSDYGIGGGTTLHLVLRLHGGVISELS